MPGIRTFLAGVLIIGSPIAAFWFTDESSSKRAASADAALASCPPDCRYLKYWGPELDSSIPFIEVSSPRSCPLHGSSARLAQNH
jgi:hypothetical protein